MYNGCLVFFGFFYFLFFLVFSFFNFYFVLVYLFEKVFLNLLVIGVAIAV